MTHERTATQLIDAYQTPKFKLRKIKLTILSGQNQGQEFIFEKNETSIGGNKDNDIVLKDKTISRTHAVIIESQGSYLLKDLNSTNGTYLGNIRICEAFVPLGSEIKFGKTRAKLMPFEDEISILPSSSPNFGECYGNSLSMRCIFSMLEKLSNKDITVLIEGETGTGKEVLAKSIHQNSLRKDKPFVVFDCSSVPENLIESELFGHKKGAFTGANTQRIGVFEQAQGGTLFLDELGELKLDLQPRLLRALENREIKKVGSNTTISVNVRVIAATNRNLVDEVKKGHFREDLFYRLSVLGLKLPTLKERIDDIEFLSEKLLQKISTEIGLDNIPEITQEAFDLLKSHDWPGNVRELKNALSRLVSLTFDDQIKPKDVLNTLNIQKKPDTNQDESSYTLQNATLEEIEKKAIIEKLKKHSGNKKKVSDELGVAYSTRYEKMKKYQIK